MAEAGKLLIIGGGVMGGTMLAGLLNAGWAPDRLTVAERSLVRRAELAEQYGITAYAATADAVPGADTVLLIVKPQDAVDVLGEMAPVLAPHQLVISLCAGIPTDLIESCLPAGQAVIRVMPNTPAQVGEGMAAVSLGQAASAEQGEVAMEIMGAVGKAVLLPEAHQDAVTAISGTGPAYLFYVVEAMVEGGVQLGLPRTTASELVVQTMLGSALLLRDSKQHPTVLRENVTSPGGTTAAAVRQLEDHKVRAAFFSAMEAARDRSRALADQARAAQ